MARIRRGIFYAVIVVFVAGAAALAGIYPLWAEIRQAGSLAGFIENELNSRSDDVEVAIGDASLGFRFTLTPLYLRAENTRINTDRGSFVIPGSELSLSIVNMLTGNFVPSKLKLSGLDIAIQYREGWRAAQIEGGVPLFILFAEPSAIKGSELTSSLDEITIEDTRIEISGAGEALIIEGLEAGITYQDQVLKSIFSGTLEDSGQVQIDLSTDRKIDTIEVKATLSGVATNTVYPYLGIDFPELRDAGIADGQVTAFLQGGHLVRLVGDMKMRDGTVALPDYGPIEYRQMAARFSHDIEADLLTIDTIDIESGSPVSRLVVSGQVRGVSSESPVVFSKIKGSNLPVTEILKIWPERAEPELRKMLTNALQGGTIESFDVEGVGVIDRPGRRFRTKTLDLVTQMHSLRLEAGFASIKRLVGTLSTRLELSIGQGGVIQHAGADFLLKDVSLLPKGAADPINLEGIEVSAEFKGDTLRINRAAVDAHNLGQMVLEGNARLAGDWHPEYLALSVKAEQIDKTFVKQLWPKNLYPKSREWFAENINGGVINEFEVAGSFDLSQDSSQQIINLQGSAGLIGTSLTYIEDMPPLENTIADIRFQDRGVSIDIAAGMVQGLDAAGSKVVMQTTEDGIQAHLALKAKGDFGSAINLVNHDRLDILGAFGDGITQASGNADITMSMKWLIPTDNYTLESIRNPEINLMAQADNASIDSLPYDMKLSQGVLDIAYVDRALKIDGNGLLAGTPAVVALSSDADNRVDIDLTLEKSEALGRWIDGKIPVDVVGAVGGIVTMQGENGMKNLTLDANIDLDDTSISVSRLGVDKEQDNPASLNARLQINGGNITKISDIILVSDALSVEGQMTFDESGSFLGAYFDKMEWADNDLSMITAEYNDKNILRITAQAGHIDLTPLRREESPGEGVALEIEMIADTMILDGDVNFTGNALLKTDEDGVGSAHFLGSLFLNNKPFMSEATMDATFGGGFEFIQGNGLVGGAQTTLFLAPSVSGGKEMTLESDNAGQLLKALNITENIRSGSIEMMVDFAPAKEGYYEVNAILGDFNVIEAPKVIRAFSVLSLAGFYSLLEGDGTNFREGSAHIEVTPERQIIHQAHASGSAVGVDFVGVIDTTEKQVEISGILVPFHALTRTISQVPIINGLLTGLDNAGLFTTQFQIKGDVDDPESSVNLASIAPGVVRDIFSPDWLQNERERIINNNGDEGDASGASRN